MKMIVLFFSCVVGSVAGACSTTSSDANPTGYLTPRVLNSTPDLYDGKEVVVRGYILLGTNGRSLRQSKDEFRRYARALRNNAPDSVLAKYSDDCLTLLPANFVMDSRELLEDKTLTVKGVFSKDYNDGTRVDLQACGRNALILDKKYMAHVFQTMGSGN